MIDKPIIYIIDGYYLEELAKAIQKGVREVKIIIDPNVEGFKMVFCGEEPDLKPLHQSDNYIV